MKKLFLTLAIVTASLIGSAQTFTYEVRNVQSNGLPSVNADSTASVYPYIITVGIAGDKYNFCSPNPGKDVMSVTFPYKTKYSDDEKYKIAWGEAVQWVEQNYPQK